MLYSNKSIIPLFLASIMFAHVCVSCNIVTWEYLEVSSNAPENSSFFDAAYLELDFSRAPDIREIEKLAKLQTAEGPISFELKLSGKCLYVRPQTLWRRGIFYTFSLEGSLRLDDGRYNTVNFRRDFYYGNSTDTFILAASSSPLPSNDNSLVFVFSSPPSVPSFLDKFRLTPYVDTNTFFSADGLTVSIKPKNGWTANTIYSWKIAGIEDKNGVFMTREYSDSFSTIEDTSLPELLTVCPVSYNPLPSLWHTSLGIDGNLLERDAIGFIFSKPMDANSVYTGLTFYPSIAGYFVKESDERFIFVPEENYEIQKEYRLTASKGLKCKNGLSLFEEKLFFFTAASSYLSVTSITSGAGLVAVPFPGDDPFDITLESPDKLSLTITFSSAIPENLRRKAVESVSLEAYFPLLAGTPVLLSASWTSSSSVTLSYDSLSKSTTALQYYYKLTIKGGKNNVQNAAGEYFKEDICVYFHTL